MSRYPFPRDLFLGLALDLPRGFRSFASDTCEMMSRVDPPPLLEGVENIPVDGPLVVAANHYQRRGLWIAWPGAIITAALWRRRGQEPPVHWLVTGGIRLSQWRDSGPEIPFTRPIFSRVANTYGMAALPLSGSRERGQILRRWIEWGRRGEALGIFPEGLAGNSDGLREPEAGFAALCRIIAGLKIPIVPCGIWEDGERLVITFGDPLSINETTSPRVMQAIAALLPPELRGAYVVSPRPESSEPLPLGGTHGSLE